MSIFISSQSIDAAQAASLVGGLHRAHVKVEHSPRDPRDGGLPLLYWNPDRLVVKPVGWCPICGKHFRQRSLRLS